MNELKSYLIDMVCATCLSIDRELVVIQSLPGLNALLKDLQLNNEGRICWECRAVLVKFINFEKKARKAQQTIQKAMEGSVKSLETLSSLQWVLTCNGIQIPIQYQSSKIEIQDGNENSNTSDYMEELKEENNIIEEPNMKNNIYFECIADMDEDDQEESNGESMYEFRDSYREEFTDDNEFKYRKDNIIIDDEEAKKLIDNTLEAFLTEISQKNMKQRKGDILMLLNDENELQEDSANSIEEVNESSSNVIEIDSDETTDVDLEGPDESISELFDIDLSELLKNVIKKKLNIHEMHELMKRDKTNKFYLQTEFQCERCGFGFNNNEQYKDHDLRHHGSHGPEECAVCEQRFPDRKSAAKHYKQHFIAYKCKQCDYMSRFVKYVLEHQRNNECDKSEYPVWYLCDICDEKFMLESLLTHHRLSVHRMGHICKYCNKLMSDAKSRAEHEKIHTGRDSVRCHICGKSYVDVKSFQAHLRIAHSFTGKRAKYCSICKKYYKSRIKFQSHLDSHKSKK